MLDEMFGDEIYIISLSGERVGPVKASVQGNKVIINDEKLVVEEGGKILRVLPNGKAESHSILQVDFHKDPFGNLSHYDVRTRKDASLVPLSRSPTINISHSHGIQIGDGNMQHIVGSIQMLAQAIDAANASPQAKAEAKSKLKDFLAHPVTTAVLGAAATAVFGAL